MARSILIVDDNPNDVEITRAVLSDLGRKEKLESAPSGEVALERLRSDENLPDVILLDLKTFGMNGLETLRHIRADRRLQHIPVVMVSGSAYPGDEREAYDAEADGFLYKDFDMDRFGSNLDALLRRFLKD